MSPENIIRAWKDEEYRNSLSEEQQAQLPENPVGLIELGDTDMESITGGDLSIIDLPGKLKPRTWSWFTCSLCTRRPTTCNRPIFKIELD